MAGVQFAEVRKSFGAFPVIKGVNIDIADGEFVILVGPSGCGKSTLLRMFSFFGLQRRKWQQGGQD